MATSLVSRLSESRNETASWQHEYNKEFIS